MSLASGTRFGPYEILSPLGAGGMGEVYRARDTKLKRDVAVKVLPDTFARDTDRLARFEREAELLATLNHPNIAAIYGLEESDGVQALVLELVEGPTLADRIEHGVIPLDEALPIARQIADAFEAAHEHGIIHRDLKPANIKLRSDGTVKVLDFGLAKSLEKTPLPSDLTRSPTVLSPTPTLAGVILGTAAYMSPEQARGKAVDKRSDIWAFGCVLFEMLTGKKPFEGETLTDTIAAIVKNEPDWHALPLGTPLQIQSVIARCLRKDPAQRLHDIADGRFQIEDVLNDPGSSTPPVAPSALTTPRRTAALASIVTLAAVIGVGVGVGVTVRRSPAPASLVRFGLLPESGSTFAPAPATGGGVQSALSPDGRYLAFIAAAGGTPRLWVRALDGASATALPETIGASFPFWSPDSRAIGYFARGMLQRIEVTGAGAQTLAPAPAARGGAWSREGVILFCPTSGSGLMRVPAGGGKVEPATSLAAGHSQRISAEYWPVFLPDGRHFLSFALAARKEDRGVYIGTLGSPETKPLADTETMAAFADGYLLFVRQGTLVAEPFDVNRLELTGVATPVAEHIGYYANLGYAAFSVSQTGLLTYAPSMTTPGQLSWFDRTGRREASVGGLATYATPSLSPDGSRAVAAIFDPQNGTNHLWLFDLTLNTSSRLTLNPESDFFPVWSPDGRTLAFSSDRGGMPDLYQKPSAGIGQEKRILATDAVRYPSDWSRDGTLVYTESTTRGYDVLLLPMAGDRSPIPALQTPFNEAQGRLSPDGRWMAYVSDESARLEVYVQPLPPTGARWQVSTDGGAQPAWRGDGKELFYVAADGKMMAVSVNPTARDFDAGVPRPLFEVTMPEVSVPYYWHYAVTRDGQRFLVNNVNRTSSSLPITVLLNWGAALKK